MRLPLGFWPTSRTSPLPHRRGRRPVRALLRAQGGLAALEFALTAPIVLAMALGAYDLIGAYLAWRKVTQATQAIGEIATAVAANTDNTNSLTLGQATTATSALYAYLPSLQSGATSSFGVALTGVAFEPTAKNCTGSGCQFKANTTWSRGFQGTMSVARPCGALAAAPDVAAPDSTTLPSSAFSAAPLLVVDVGYQFKPVALQFIKQDITMRRAAYFPMRTGTNDRWLHYVDPSNPQARCPGYDS